jgi:hypothetical protein
MMREIYENSCEVVIWLGEEQRLDTYGGLTGEYKNSELKPIEWHDDDRDSTIIEVYHRVFVDRRLGLLRDRNNVSDMLGAFCLIRLLSKGIPSKDVAFFNHISWAGAVVRVLWAIMKLPWVRAILI